MSASGFTWCYLSFLVLTANYFQWITQEETAAALDLGYILLIPFILFAGDAITLDSWANAYRNGGFLNYGAAAWNTYASIHNTYSALGNLGGAFDPASAICSEAAAAGTAATTQTRSSLSRSWWLVFVCGRHAPRR